MLPPTNQHSAYLLETPPDKVCAHDPASPLCHNARQGVCRTQTKNLIKHHYFPDIDNDCEGKRRSNDSCIPCSLFGSESGAGLSSDSNFSLNFFPCQVDGELLSISFGLEFDFIGIDESLQQRSTDKLQNPGEDHIEYSFDSLWRFHSM